MPPSDQYHNCDTGYCEHRRTMIGIIRTWKSGTVTEVECDHLRCGYYKNCELYQKAPVGFTEHAPDAPAE